MISKALPDRNPVFFLLLDLLIRFPQSLLSGYGDLLCDPGSSLLDAQLRTSSFAMTSSSRAPLSDDPTACSITFFESSLKYQFLTGLTWTPDISYPLLYFIFPMAFTTNKNIIYFILSLLYHLFLF